MEIKAALITFITLFWILFSLQVYIYIGYPLIIWVVARMRRREESSFDGDYCPFVTVIIPARNEERVIERKLKNTISIDYPSEKMEIIVVSDGSTDSTESIVAKYKYRGVKLISLPERKGKTAAQNMAVEESRGEILIFSDANAFYAPDAVKNLVLHFKMQDVGCVSGELSYVNPEGTTVGKEESIYWRYEKFIKRQEDSAGTILGANGSIYAVRRSDYVELEEDIISDFIEPLEIVSSGKRVVYEPRAVSVEESSKAFKEEFLRKRRIICRSLRSLCRHSHLFSPIRNRFLSFEIFSHKILRWLSPLLFILLFTVSAIQIRTHYVLFIFCLQLSFLLFALVGRLLEDNSKLPGWFFVPYYICLLGLASIVGIADFLRGKEISTWDPIR